MYFGFFWGCRARNGISTYFDVEDGYERDLGEANDYGGF